MSELSRKLVYRNIYWCFMCIYPLKCLVRLLTDTGAYACSVVGELSLTEGYFRFSRFQRLRLEKLLQLIGNH